VTTAAPTTQQRQIRRISLIGLILSVLGIADGTYLTIAHYTSASILACPATSFINCQKVTSSSYSSIHGIPVAVLGLIFFVFMFALQLPAAWRSDNQLLRAGRILFSIAGLGSVFWFVFVELFRLDAICLYCTGIHILTFGIFVTTLVGSALISPQSEEERST
jgi:uncharacterized membrane protein